MLRRSNWLVLLAATVVLFAPRPASAADEWAGTWKLNVAKSKFSPPELAPKSRTVVQEPAEGGMKVVIEEVDAQGKTVRTEYLAKYDNKDYPWTADANADTFTVQRLDDEFLQTTWKLKGEIMLLGSSLVSKDRKTLTTTVFGKDPQGRKIGHVTVYDRQ